MHIFTVYLNGLRVRTFAFDGTRPITIGRSANSDVVLKHQAVSRTHAVIYDYGRQRGDASPELPTLEDLGSTNGLKVNDARTTKAVLRNGDEIDIRPFILVYESDGEFAAQPSMAEAPALPAEAEGRYDPGFVKLAGDDVSPDTTLQTRVMDEPFLILKSPGHHGVLVSNLGTHFAVSRVTYSVVGDSQQPPTLNGVALAESLTTIVDGDILVVGNDEYRFSVSVSWAASSARKNSREQAVVAAGAEPVSSIPGRR